VGAACAGLHGETAGSKVTPVTGFTLTGFGADGYKTWDLQGGQALVAAEGQPEEIPIKDLKLHLFNGAEPMVLESTIESPEATVYARESVAKGPGFLYIKSDTYTVQGRVWDWDGKQHVIHVGKDVQVTFVSAVESKPGTPPPTPVTIHSNQLEIREEPTQNRFLFSGNVNVTEGIGETTCRTLEVLADKEAGAKPAGGNQTATADTASPSTGSTSSPQASSGQAPSAPGVGRIEKIYAHDEVVVRQDQIEAWAQQAEITPAEDKAVLSGSPLVRDRASDALLSGGRVTWWRGTHQLDVEPEAEGPGEPPRVHVSLPPLSTYQDNGTKVTPPRGPDAPRLLVSGETLHASLGTSERHFVMERSVHVVDPTLTVDANHLEATFDALTAPAGNPSTSSGQASSTGAGPVAAVGNGTETMGKLNHLMMRGDVVIHQPGRVTTTDQADISPPTGEVVLTGSPRVEDAVNKAVITGSKIILLTDVASALVDGTGGIPATLTLPALPGLAAEGSKPGAETRVTSDKLAMQRGDAASHFLFTGNVKVTGQDMETTCEQLEAFTRNSGPAGTSALTGPGEVGEVMRLLARGHVVIHQRDYEAHAATAEIFPRADVVQDGATASQPHRYVELHGDPAGILGPVRPLVILPPMGDLGWDESTEGNPSTSSGQASTGNITGNTTASPAPAANSTPTVITSDEQELLTSPAGNQYWFEGNVEIDGALKATCDKMEVLATPAHAAGNTTVATATPESGAIDRILAEGHVVITQGTRRATAGQAEITPGAGEVVLTENPLVVDSADGTQAIGARMVLKRGERKAFIEGPEATPGQPAQRPTLILPPMNFDNFGKPDDKQASPSSP
jgi:lipopolysaccharide export system protein LptA